MHNKPAGQRHKGDLRQLKGMPKVSITVLPSKQKAVVVAQSDGEEAGTEMSLARPRRQTTIPRHLDGYDLSQ